MTAFKDIPLKGFFRLHPGGKSFQKTSYFGYYVDTVLGEIQVQGELEVFPIDPSETPTAPI